MRSDPQFRSYIPLFHASNDKWRAEKIQEVKQRNEEAKRRFAQFNPQTSQIWLNQT